MSRSETRSSIGSMFGSLAGPLLWGLAATAGFYYLVYRGPLGHPLVQRYFAGHPINMIETALFLIGLAALALKLADLVRQYSAVGSVGLSESTGPQSADAAAEWLAALGELPARLQQSYLARRLMDALTLIQQRKSADGLADDLKYLAEVDASKAHDSYALVRIVIWATPMLGFLGTVVGITDALGDLGRELGNTAPDGTGGSLNLAMEGLLSGLYVAFDTTAIALCFSIALMFIQFMLDRAETELLAAVDHQVGLELGGRFEIAGVAADPNVQALQRISQSVLRSTEELVQRQAELWQQSIAAAHNQWQQVSQHTTEQLQTALAGALGPSLAQHAAHLANAEQACQEQLSARWEQWQTALSQNARLLHAQQQEMVKQGELLTQAVRAAGDVVQLERALNDNLGALAGAKNFEDTVMSLAAAIHLLNVRLGKAVDGPQVELKHVQAKGRAA